MAKVFGEKLDWKHVAIFVLLIALVYFIMKHNGVKGAYHALLSDVHMDKSKYTKKKRDSDFTDKNSCYYRQQNETGFADKAEVAVCTKAYRKCADDNPSNLGVCNQAYYDCCTHVP